MQEVVPVCRYNSKRAGRILNKSSESINIGRSTMINIWNALPDSIVKSPSVSSFKLIAFISVIFVLIVLYDRII